MRTLINFIIRGHFVGGEIIRGKVWRWLILLCGGECGKNLRIGRSVKFKYAPHSKIKFGSNVYIGDYCVIDCPPFASLSLGDSVQLNLGSFIAVNGTVDIGRYTLIAEYVSIRDHDHGFAISQQVHLQDNVVSPISIGDDVWIGRGVAILRGVNLGSKAVIGANAVVKKDIPCAAVAVGVPAKVVKTRE